ncbi:MAG: YggS family pyridoxal phosphate-dependent enzyme [Planctomycetota bacterium]|jgi:pyridoxal phosphate enzyme (YggS family)
MAVTKNRIDKNLLRIRENIAEACQRARRRPADVAIVAVTKAVGLEEIKLLMDAGLTDLAESRVQQLTQRAAEVAGYLQRRRTPPASPVRWHMVGHLQRNKVKDVIDIVEVIHSVDSLRLAEEIHTRAEKAGRTIDVMLQVNCSYEARKFGCAVGAGTHLAELICTLKHLKLIGLMTMAPLVKNPEHARPTFVRLRELFEEMRDAKIGGEGLRHLSMGMTQDYAVAIEEGATILRIGTALFQ